MSAPQTREHADIVEIVERLYRVELPEREWLSGIVDATRKVLDYGLGVNAFTYSIDASNRMSLRELVASFKEETVSMVMKQLAADLSARYVAGSYGSLLCSTARETPGFAELPSKKVLAELGVQDVFGVNGIDPGGTSAFIGVPSPTPVTVSRTMRDRWERVAAHVAASNRLRLRLAAEARSDVSAPLGAEAVLSTTGRIEHAEGAAQSKVAQAALRDGLARMERARGPQRRHDPDRSVTEWRGLIAARWTLVEVREIDGRRYLLACENENRVPRIGALSSRERQVAVFASMGYPHKLTAYHLGLSPSTIRVVFGRLLNKLRLRNRAELIRLFNERPGEHAT